MKKTDKSKKENIKEETKEDVKHYNSVEEAVTDLNKIPDSDKNKPTEEEILEAEKEFKEKSEGFNYKKFDIGEAKEASDIYSFVIDFMENHVYWTKNGWMGVLKMHEELTEALKNHKDGEKFSVGYQALEFMFYALTNPGGRGLVTAKAVEKVADFYAHVIEISGEVLENARKELKDIQWLQDKINAMKQGFYLEKEDGVEKPEQAFKSPSADELLKGNKDKVEEGVDKEDKPTLKVKK